MSFEFTKAKSNFKGKLCGVLTVILVVLCLQPGFTAIAAYSDWNVTGGNVTGGNVTGGNITGGNVTSSNVNGVYLKLNRNRRSYYVSGISDDFNTIVIPSTFNGLPVTRIGAYSMFFGEDVSIIIPDTVTTIDDYAFYDCHCIKIFVSESVVNIGEKAFRSSYLDFYGYRGSYIEEYVSEYDCGWFYPVSKFSDNFECTPITRNKLELSKYWGCDSEIIIPSEIDEYSVYAIAEGAFAYNLSINSVVLSESLVKVDEYAFEGCENLESVIFASGTKTIGSYAFSGCENLSKVVLPSTIEKLDAYTFENCLSLTEIIIPESVTEIDIYAFYNCVNLETIYGKTGSYAEEFAEENGYTFMDVSGKIVDIKATPVKFIENAKGYYDTDDNGDDFFCYYLDEACWYPRYTITYGSGESEVVGFSELELLLDETIEVVTDQYNAPFKFGTNKIKLKAGSYSFSVCLEIVENPVQSIETKDISIIEGTSGYLQHEYDENCEETDEYYYRYWLDNVQFTATLKDGNTVESSESGYITLYDVDYWTEIADDQHSNHWGVGTHTATIDFLGVTDDIFVIITETPVESVECEDIIIFENSKGYITSHYDENDNEYSYYHYTVTVDCTINLKNGKSFKCDEYGNFRYNGEYYDVYFDYTQQYDSPWVKGNSYPVTIHAMGVIGDYNIEIVDNNIKSVKATVVNPYYRGLTDDLSANEFVVDIEYKDGSVESLRYYGDELWENGFSFFVTEDFNEMFSVGTHKAQISYMGYDTEFEYQVVENPYNKIEISSENGLTLFLYNKDGTVTKTTPHFMDIRAAGPDEIIGYLCTSEGAFISLIQFETDKCSNFKIRMGEMESNVLPKNYWYKALDVSRRLSDIVYDCCPSLSDYNGVITAQNIDDIVASYYLLSGFSGENVVIDSEYCGTLNGETVRHGIAEIYGIDDIDLSLSSRYNSENDTFVVSGLGCSADSSKDTIYYSNNTWIFNKSYSYPYEFVDVKVELDDNGKVRKIQFGNIFNVIDNQKTTIDEDKDIIFTESSLVDELDSLLLLDEGISTKIEYSHDYQSSQIIGTGSVVEFYDKSGNLIDTYTAVIVGDLNGDGVCDVLDSSLCALYANEKKSPTVIQAYAANGEANNVIDIDAYQNVANMSVS